MSAAQLILGSVDLLGMDGYEALGDDGSWGSPQPIDVTLQSLLQDGSVVVTQGYDNREVTLRVRLTGSDSAELASLESTLFAEVGKRNTLTYVPPDGWGPASVFEVVTSRLEHTLDDVAEVRSCERTYGLTLVCEPFARSADQFTVVGATVSDPAPTPPPPTTITDGISGTNWTVHTAKPTTYGGVAFSTNPILQLGYNKPQTLTTHVYEYTSTFSVGQQKYLALDWQIRGTGALMKDVSPALMVNNAAGSTTGGIALTRVAQMSSPDNAGYTRTLWQIPASVSSITRLRFTATMDVVGFDMKQSLPRGFAIRLVQLTSQPLVSGTTRQKTMTITVPGSAPTVGSLQVSHPSTALGDLLVYSWADNGCGYSPAMRKFRTSGGTLTPDSASYSGATEPLSGSVVYDVPTSQLPSGLYVLYARLKRTVAGSTTLQVDATTTSAASGQTLPGGTVTAKQTVALTTSFAIVPIGRLMLPTVDAGGYGKAHLVVTNPGDGSVTLDELYLCNATIGRTTIVNAGTLGTTPTPGGAPSTVWINSPTTDSPRPSIMGGTQADGSDAYNIESLTSSSQPHRWEAGARSVFTACAASDATTTLTGYAHWHTHAADDQAA